MTAERRIASKAGGRGSDASDPDGWADGTFRTCFVECYPRVLAYVLRRLSDRAGAEDVAAETFLIAWRRREELPADPLPWLLAVARNQLLNSQRGARRQQRLVSRVASEPVLDPVAPPGESRGVLEALAKLDERDREVLMLLTWDGLDRRRAATVLGCSETTFAVRLHRARRRLAVVLESRSSTSEETQS